MTSPAGTPAHCPYCESDKRNVRKTIGWGGGTIPCPDSWHDINTPAQLPEPDLLFQAQNEIDYLQRNFPYSTMAKRSINLLTGLCASTQSLAEQLAKTQKQIKYLGDTLKLTLKRAEKAEDIGMTLQRQLGKADTENAALKAKLAEGKL